MKINSNNEVTEIHQKMDSKSYQELVNTNPGFMFELENKIIRKWIAIHNSVCRNNDSFSEERNKEIIDMIKAKVIPTLKKNTIYERTPDLIFEDPSIEWCGMEIKISQLDMSGLFKNYRSSETLEIPNKFPEVKRLDSEKWK